MFQYAALLDSLTVYDNIVFGLVRHRKHISRQELDELVRDLLEQVELPGIEDRYPSELSGGMQKRVGLARALAMKPSIVFYDEPTSGLDPITSNTIDELIMETRRRHQVTSVVVSHHLPSIFRISDHIAMLHKGEIVVFGTPEEIANPRRSRSSRSSSIRKPKPRSRRDANMPPKAFGAAGGVSYMKSRSAVWVGAVVLIALGAFFALFLYRARTRTRIRSGSGSRTRGD